MENFCGSVSEDATTLENVSDQVRIYVCGDLSKLKDQHTLLFIIEELSHNYKPVNHQNHQLISLGKVPVVIHEAGVYFRNFFEGSDYFRQIKSEHEFQELTESTKQSKALRKGIYLSKISKEVTSANEEALGFHLLRCSSNLTGPTDNFRNTDHQIMEALNSAAKNVFEEETALNHVLAQVYENKKSDGPKPKETKAKIKAHSDKTKDMPENGLIAFCTFYEKPNFEHLKPSKTDRYDWCHKETSGLTRLHFKLKNSVRDSSLIKEFSVTLYPNSVFIIPLSTNRLYTHEIRPSVLNIDRIPKRMGYVVRCSNLEAVFINDQTFIREDGKLIKLEERTPETMADLRTTYFEENSSENRVEYGKVHFSMNTGDYQKPIY